MDAQLIYPAPLFVRNTFIDCREARPPSLEEFLQERLVKSCPTSGVSGVDRPPLQGHQMAQNAYCETRRSGRPTSGEGDNSSECSTTDTAAGIGGPARPLPNDVLVLDLQSALAQSMGAAPQPLAPPAQPSAVGPQPLGTAMVATSAALPRGAAGVSPGLAEAAGPAPPQAASASSPTAAAPEAQGDLPSAGSAGHFTGRCKPCAFVNSKGCSIGKDCQFCHICEPGEKKRRQKEKRAFFGTMRRLQKSAGEVWPSVASWR